MAESAWSPREAVAEYARKIHDFVWTLDEGVVLMYNKNYHPRTNGRRLVFDGWQPYVACGTVRGVPYSLSIFSNGLETPFSIYQRLSDEERGELAWIYGYYKNGDRLSAKYGMSCATMVSECMQQGFPDEELPLAYGVKTLITTPEWKKHFTFGKNGAKNYPGLRTADLLYNSGHVVLVMENDSSAQRVLIMEQTPPDHAVAHCENLTEVEVELMYRGHPTRVTAKRLCMQCPACLQATTGTQLRYASYTELRKSGYQAIFVDYGDGSVQAP